MSRMPIGMYIPGRSYLHRLQPLAKMIAFIIFLPAVIATNSAGGYLLLILFIGGLLAISGVSLQLAISPLRRIYLFFVIIFIMNALFFADTDPLWAWWIFCLSRTGIIQGANAVLRVVLIIVVGQILMATTSPLEITAALKRLLSPLQYIRIPVDIVSMIISAAIHFIPVLAEEVELIRKAQTARGAKFDSVRMRDRAASVTPMVIPIFIGAFKRADELALAMESRGYRTGGQRMSGKKEPLNAQDFVALAIVASICAIQIYLL